MPNYFHDVRAGDPMDLLELAGALNLEVLIKDYCETCRIILIDEEPLLGIGLDPFYHLRSFILLSQFLERVTIHPLHHNQFILMAAFRFSNLLFRSTLTLAFLIQLVPHQVVLYLWCS